MAAGRQTAVGDLTEIVIIDAETTPAHAEAEPTWAEIGRMRAAVVPLRASESERQGALRTLQVYQVTVLARAARVIGVGAQHRLRWLTHPTAPATSYNVREVRAPDARQMFCDLIVESGVTE